MLVAILVFGFLLAFAQNSPTITITQTVGSNPSCAGTTLDFSAVLSNAPANPTYQWTKNGISISGATTSTYSSQTLSDKDTIRCLLTSSNLSVTSNAIVLNINAKTTPKILISTSAAGPICYNETVYFGVLALYGGTSPAYQWVKNGVDIAEATDSVYMTTILTSGDQIQCRLTSNASCLTTSIAISIPMSVIVAPTYSFVGNGSWSDQANWVDNRVPPLRIPPCALVVIDPTVGGECVLDYSLFVPDSATLKIISGKRFIVKGNLIIGKDTTNSSIPFSNTSFGAALETSSKIRTIPLLDTVPLANSSPFERSAGVPKKVLHTHAYTG